MSDDKLPVPKSGWKDTAYDAAQFVTDKVTEAISGVPSIGGALFGMIFTPPFQKRTTESIGLIVEAIDDLRTRGVDVEALGEDAAFIDTMLQVYGAAVMTSNEEKRESLRNAILNSALPSRPSDAKRELYIRWIRDLTVWHIRMLDFYDDPKVWFVRNKKPHDLVSISKLIQLWTRAYPEMASDKEFNQSIWKQLTDASLMNFTEMNMIMSAEGALQSRTTQLGKGLLAFIRSPLQAVPVGEASR